jgi:hypothetical protein
MKAAMKKAWCQHEIFLMHFYLPNICQIGARYGRSWTLLTVGGAMAGVLMRDNRKRGGDISRTSTKKKSEEQMGGLSHLSPKKNFAPHPSQKEKK